MVRNKPVGNVLTAYFHGMVERAAAEDVLVRATEGLLERRGTLIGSSRSLKILTYFEAGLKMVEASTSGGLLDPVADVRASVFGLA